MLNSVSHRGYSTLAPENTLAAYRLSAQMGFEMVECDVAFTADNQAVLLHDLTIDRTSNGTGRIDQMTLAQVRTYDFGNWKSEQYRGERIPTFEEFIALCKQLRLYPYIELKVVKTEQVKSLVETVKRYGMLRCVTWISFSDELLGEVLKCDGGARCGYIAEDLTPEVLEDALSLRTPKSKVFLNLNFYAIDEQEIDACEMNEIPLEVWGLDSAYLIERMDPYISGVTSETVIASEVLEEQQDE